MVSQTVLREAFLSLPASNAIREWTKPPKNLCEMERNVPGAVCKWNSSLCNNKRQHRQPKVMTLDCSELNHELINQFSFQFREFYRATSKRPAANHVASPIGDQSAQASNQVPSMSRYSGVISNEINPPEVLSNRDGISQSKLRRNKKQQNQQARGNKTLNLTGNVDLGRMNLKQNRPSRRKNGTRRIQKTTTTTPHPNTISEIFPVNHHRHNHYETRPQHNQPKPETSTAAPVIYRPETSTSRAYSTPSTTTINPPTSTVIASNTTPMSPKELEKVIKVDFMTSDAWNSPDCVFCSRNDDWKASGRSSQASPTSRSSSLWNWKQSAKLRGTGWAMTQFSKLFPQQHASSWPRHVVRFIQKISRKYLEISYEHFWECWRCHGNPKSLQPSHQQTSSCSPIKTFRSIKL